MRRRVRIGLAGLGRMGRIHAASLAARCPSAELACVFDADAELAGQVAGQFGVDRAESYDSVLSDESIDAVAIATPTGTHAELAARAARAGKHVFCEKPISLDRQATVQAIEAVRAAGRMFQVGFHRRFDPDWVAVEARIRAGELGEVRLFRTSLRDMAPPEPEFLAGSGGFFVDCTIHDLDTARWLGGEVTELTAHGSALSDRGFAEIGDVDTAVVVLRFENGALGVIDESRAAGYGYEASTEVMGSRATARIDDPYDRHYEWRTPGLAAHGLPLDFEQRFGGAYANELEHFARCVRDGVAPEPSATDALAAFDLARAAEQSWREGHTIAVHAERTDDGVHYTVKQETQ